MLSAMVLSHMPDAHVPLMQKYMFRLTDSNHQLALAAAMRLWQSDESYRRPIKAFSGRGH
jgi:hypothetical protein